MASWILINYVPRACDTCFGLLRAYIVITRPRYSGRHKYRADCRVIDASEWNRRNEYLRLETETRGTPSANNVDTFARADRTKRVHFLAYVERELTADRRYGVIGSQVCTPREKHPYRDHIHALVICNVPARDIEILKCTQIETFDSPLERRS